MFIQTSELLGQVDLRNDIHPQPHLQSSLRHFVREFSLAGSGVFQFRHLQPHPRPIAYWSDAAFDEVLSGLRSSDWQRPCALFEVVPIKRGSFQVYGCLLKQTAEGCDYLICWQAGPVSSHQQYGISLFAKALNWQSPLRGEPSFHQLQQVRHQLRTPLALILLYADLLKTATLDARSQTWLDHLQTIAAGMNISLDRLTERQDEGGEQTLSQCDLRELLGQCSEEMQPWIEEKQLKLIYKSYPIRLRANEWKLKQAFQNLLSNAIAFSPEAGQITWDWQVFQTEVLIKISDQGPGLSAEDLRSIGTPFYSRRPGGTGLGLTIAKQVILEHQGSLWAVNLPSGGAQFCLTLPRS